MEYKDYYKILGVARDAGDAEIKRAYRRLARKYHPDVSKERDAEEHFKTIAEAYAVLGDAEKRAAYDQLGPYYRPGQDFRPPPGWQRPGAGGPDPRAGFSGADFSDFFESLFGARGFGARAPKPPRREGGDRSGTLEVTLEEAFHGTTKTVQLAAAEPDPFGRARAHARTLSVRVPPGVSAGQKIRLAGQGETGQGGAASGDLYLEIQLLPHRLYKVEGRDLTLELPIAPWEAALGAKVEVPTLGGRVTLSIPPGSQSGQKLRLRSRGLPGDPAGDQYVRLLIVNPPTDSARVQELFRRLRDEAAFDPRARLG